MEHMKHPAPREGSTSPFYIPEERRRWECVFGALSVLNSLDDADQRPFDEASLFSFDRLGKLYSQ